MGKFSCWFNLFMGVTYSFCFCSHYLLGVRALYVWGVLLLSFIFLFIASRQYYILHKKETKHYRKEGMNVEKEKAKAC